MKKSKRLYHFVKPIYAIPLKILYRPKFVGIENIPKEGPILFAANHKMAFDPLLVLVATKREVSYLAKSELFRGFHGWIFRKIGMIPVYRGKQNTIAVLEAEEILKSGGAIGIFPEGKRNRTKEELLPFRTGAVRMAKETKTPIIPCAITGQYHIFRKGLQIEFGKPICVDSYEVDEANEKIREEIRTMLRK